METLLDRRTPPGRRMGHWDETAILIAYRHGPRASELCTHVMPRDGVATARPSSATRLLSVLRESCYRHQDQQCDDHQKRTQLPSGLSVARNACIGARKFDRSSLGGDIIRGYAHALRPPLRRPLSRAR